MTTRVLVTGAQGFIGRAVVAEWLAADPDATVVGLGRSPRDDGHATHEVSWRGRRWPAPTPPAQLAALADPRYQYVVQDLGDTPGLTRLLAELAPHYVIHLAASLRDDPPAALVRNNVGAVVSVIEATVGAGIDPPRLVFGSSGSVYGVVEGRGLPLTEDMPCHPIDPYSVTKLSAEQLSHVMCRTYGLDATWARIFNPLGAAQDERHLCGWLGQQVASIVAGIEPPEIRVGPLDTTRDFVDIGDTAAAIAAIATRGEPGQIYNVASGVERSGQEILDTLLEVAGLEGVTIIPREGRPADMPRHVASVDRLCALGAGCDRPLADSLGDVIDHYLGPVEAAASAGVDRSAPVDEPRIEVRARRDDGYPVELSDDLVDRLPTLLATRFPRARFAVLTDSRVADLHGSMLVGRMRDADLAVELVVVPEGEQSKTLGCFERVIERLHAARIDRRSVLVNLGGGMITDLGGFVASAYLRGIAYVNVPTTLLAQHDSAIGGKVGIDTAWAKNFVGAFHHPHAVYCDPSVLKSLAVRELRSGLAESIKVAVCGAPRLFEFLEDHVEALLAGDPGPLEVVVRQSILGKARLLDPDPYEIDLRRALNLGHTFGHALEVEMEFAGVTHGEAVAFGLAIATALGRARDLCAPEVADRILGLLDRFGLPPTVPRERLVGAARRVDDVRLVRGGRLNYVVPTAIDSVTILPSVDPEEVLAAVDAVAADSRLGRAVC